MKALSAAHSRAAELTSVSSTGCRSKVERLMTLSTSAVAVCCCSDSVSSLRAVLDLLLELGVGLLELAGHVVELVGERLELVAGLDQDALVELAAADALGALAQRLDRHHHPSRQEHAGERREEQRPEEQDAGALDRFVERRIGLLDRQLDEDEPAQRRDARVGGEHLAALRVARLLQLVAVGGVAAPPGPAAGRDRSVLRRTRLMSGWAMSRPCDPTT